MLAVWATMPMSIWLYPTSVQGKPVKRYMRPSSVVTQTAGARKIARAPWRVTRSASAAANSAGKAASTRTNRACTPQAAGGGSPPKLTMTSGIQ